MKIKSDFITNSSSASFTIAKCNLTDTQIDMIYNHINVATIIAEKKDIPINTYDATKERTLYTDEWEIDEDPSGKNINGYTSMDNFDMLWFLTLIGIKYEIIDYETNG